MHGQKKYIKREACIYVRSWVKIIIKNVGQRLHFEIPWTPNLGKALDST